jgi:RNA polymerase sigma-B factor
VGRARAALAPGTRPAAATGRPVTAAELASDLDLPVETVVEGRVAASAMRTDSIDRPLTSDRDPGARTLAETRGDVDTGYARVEDRAVLDAALATLNGRDRLVLDLRYREELSQSAIGSRIGVSQMQVSRILRRIEADLAETATASLV